MIRVNFRSRNRTEKKIGKTADPQTRARHADAGWGVGGDGTKEGEGRALPPACERRNEDAPSDELHGPRCHLSNGSGEEWGRGRGG